MLQTQMQGSLPDPLMQRGRVWVLRIGQFKSFCTLKLLHVGCLLESPGGAFKILRPGPYPRPMKSESLALHPGIRVFKAPPTPHPHPASD